MNATIDSSAAALLCDEDLNLMVNEAGQVLRRKRPGEPWAVVTRFVVEPVLRQEVADCAPVAITRAWIGTGSTAGFGPWTMIAGFTPDGRLLALCPFPERCLRWWPPPLPRDSQVANVAFVDVGKPVVTLADGSTWGIVTGPPGDKAGMWWSQ